MTPSTSSGQAELDIELAIDRNGDDDFMDPGEDVTADVLAETGIRVYRGNDAAKVLKSVEGHLQLIVAAAAAANDAISQIADTAADAACKGVTAVSHSSRSVVSVPYPSFP